VLGEALLVEGKNGSLDPVLLALFRREGSGQMDELGRVRYPTSMLSVDHQYFLYSVLLLILFCFLPIFLAALFESLHNWNILFNCIFVSA